VVVVLAAVVDVEVEPPCVVDVVLLTMVVVVGVVVVVDVDAVAEVVVVPCAVVVVLPCAVVVVGCMVVDVAVVDVVGAWVVDVVLDVDAGPHPACRMKTLQLACKTPAFTAAFATCAAQLTYAP
jgi:hypothetical protein